MRIRWHATASIELELDGKKLLLDHFDDAFPPLTDVVDLVPILQKYGSRIQTMHPKHDIIL